MIITDKEKEEFRKAVGKVTPIKKNNIKNSDKPKPAPSIRVNIKDKTESYYKINDISSTERKVDGNTRLSFCSAGENNKNFKKLNQGKIKYEDILDLHSLTVNEAKERLEVILDDWKHQNLSCVLIIHGKGYGSKDNSPVIKNKLNQWLKEHPMVWGFCSAQPKDGGTGAIYLYFKK